MRWVTAYGWFIRVPLRVGIIARIVVAFAAVVVLTLVANYFAEHGLIRAALTRGLAAAPIAAGERWDPAVGRASRTISESISALDAATEARMRVNSVRTNAEFLKARTTFDRTLRAYVASAHAPAASLRLGKFASDARDHLSDASGVVHDADRGRALALRYEATVTEIRTRVEAAMDGSFRLLGRVLVPHSLVDLHRALDSIRLSSQLLDSYGSPKPKSSDACCAQFASVLEAHAREFSRIEGAQWLDENRSDVGRLGVLLGELESIDRSETARLSSFRATGLELLGAINALDAGALEMRGARVPDEAARNGRMLAERLSSDGRLLRWTSLSVLSVIFLLSIATMLSIVRPVRRLIAAMGRLAAGDSNIRMVRGGIKEIDALAVAFNRMARQVAASQRQLESRVVERTLQFRHLEEHDPLTQLPNRRQLLSHLRHTVEKARKEHTRLAVLIVDLDHFKTVNETLDHGFGDRVLICIAQRVCEIAGSMSFVARLGGDEFAVIHELGSEGTSGNDDMGLRLLQAFSMPLHVDGQDLSMGISVGESVFPEDADTAEGLLRAADAAVFQAKAAGRRQMIHFRPALLEDASVRFRVAQGLRQAIDRGELELHFQPEVSLASGSVSVLEALVRWRMPDGTLAGPGQFLPAAEQSGLILEIGDWVMRRAIETIAGWYHSGCTDVRIAINVSARQLMVQGFVDHLRSLLNSERLPANCIELELTENALQTEPATVNVLRALRAEDIAVALDDFGTGYSSLASLEQLPLSRVKLDRTLIAGIHTSARSLDIARSITGLCRHLGLGVTAEGVEDIQQLALLVSEQSVLVQGFLIAKPAPAGEVPALVRTMRDRMGALLREALPLSSGSPASTSSSHVITTTVDARRSFCSTRLALLNSYVAGANAFAEAIRRSRISPTRRNGVASARAGRDARMAHETYRQHIKEHGC